MNFRPGQIFNVDGNELCLLSIIDYDMKVYGLFSFEKKTIAYMFYEIIDTGTGYDLTMVEDENLNNHLLSIFEEREENET